MTFDTSHPNPRILFVTPEIHPLNKTGGLGDVSAALPLALRKLGLDVRILIPGYPQVLKGSEHMERIAEFPAEASFPPATLLSARLKPETADIPLLIIDCPSLYLREGGPYTDDRGKDWPDNALRFGLLSKVGAMLASGASPLAWLPEIVHCNDWQSGLIPAYLNFHEGEKAASLMAVHNLAFQGVFPPETLTQLGLPKASFDTNGMEYYGNISFLKAGLYYSSHIATVSPTYASEIQRSPLGFGMEGLLARRREHITGIVNGISDEWNPATDPDIARNYTIENLADKTANKEALQRSLGLLVDPGIPLFGAVGRFAYQKGYDLLLEVAAPLTEIPAQLVLLGSGEAELERQLAEMGEKYPGKIAVRIGFDEKLAHLIEAGIDSFLMPSRFEPCGLNQMYSQRYGTPPLVHATGGLLDTVVDCTPETLTQDGASGFLFYAMDRDSLFAAILRAVAAYHDKPLWHRLMRNGMTRDFSWHSSAIAYRQLYQSLTS